MAAIQGFIGSARQLCFVILLSGVICAMPIPAAAQDAFHIQVHDYEPLEPDEFSVELHTNYVARGSRGSNGLTAPTNNQLHMAYELTAGVSTNFSLGVMLLSGKRAGSGLEYAGAKILPHFYAPKSWHLPFDFGIVVEVSYLKSLYDDNSHSLEIHPVFEKRIHKFVFDANPGVERALVGPDEREGWTFQTAVRVRYEAFKWLTPSVEYYGESPGFRHIVVGGDLRLKPRLLWSPGVGFGPTPSGNRLVFTSAIEVEFGRD